HHRYLWVSVDGGCCTVPSTLGWTIGSISRLLTTTDYGVEAAEEDEQNDDRVDAEDENVFVVEHWRHAHYVTCTVCARGDSRQSMFALCVGLAEAEGRISRTSKQVAIGGWCE